MQRIPMKRILMTGPSDRLGEWAETVNSVGWEALPFPLIDIEELGLRPEALFSPDTRFDWLCVTSRSALPFVERLAEFSPSIAEFAACVGEPSTQRVRDLGFRTPLRAAEDAAHLADLVGRHAAKNARVLWPRGQRADLLAVTLRANSFVVTDPVVYASRSRAIASMPRADAVFFASPSAYGAWMASFPSTKAPTVIPPIAIAIGKTTFEALMRDDPTSFERVTRLAEPTPAALAHVLAHLDVPAS